MCSARANWTIYVGVINRFTQIEMDELISQCVQVQSHSGNSAPNIFLYIGRTAATPTEHVY